MTDSFITGGTVSIEDGVKALEEFAPARKAKVELSFSVPEGEEGQKYLNAATDVAEAKVSEILGRKPKAVTTETPIKPARKPREKAAVETVVDTSVPGSDKAKLEVEAGLKPAEVKVAEPEQGDIDDLLGDAAPVPITDAELAKAAQTKNAQMKVKDPNFSVKIRALVVEYAGQPPKKITDVPVARRQEFLDKLRDLT